jgi:hypothetical protein
MTGLPRPLARWRTQLELFEDDLASAIGKLVLQLAPSFDSLSRATPTVGGDVDGYDGFTRRGSYERLLPSEWALREAQPLEFLRRAGAGEHAFFQLARREPASRESTLVLLDTGPDQLGACRLVQLALLILLAERAQRRGEALYWQLLHHLGEPPLTTLDEHAVKRFLTSRTALRSSQSAITTWQRSHGDFRLWLVGPPAHTAAQCFLVHLVERVDPSARVVDVTLRAPGRPPRELELAVPEPDVAVRLLRDPFDQRRGAWTTLAPGVSSNLLLSAQGTRIAYRAAAGELALVRVSGEDAGRPVRPHLYAPAEDAVVIAVASSRHKTRWLSATRHELFLSSTSRFRDGSNVQRWASPPLEFGAELWPLYYYEVEQLLAFVAPDRTLWGMKVGGEPSNWGEGVLSALADNSRPFVLAAKPRPRLLELNSRYLQQIFHETSQHWSGAFLRRHGNGWVLAYETEPGTWSIRVSKKPAHEHVMQGQPGVVGVQGPDGLLVLRNGRTELVSVSRTYSKVLLKTSSPLVSIATASDALLIAFLTEAGELGVVSDSGEIRMRRRVLP